MIASEIARSHVVTATPEESIDDVAVERSGMHVGCVIIVEDDHHVGIVTQDDFIVLLSEEISNLVGTIQTESPPASWGRDY